MGSDESILIDEDFFDAERKLIFGKVYLANVRNRLRELDNCNDVDCKRWIWELVQNAKDSISGQQDKSSVDIEIIVDEETYIFKHNGSPFNKRTLFALLYKFSEDDRKSPYGFSATLYREGEDQELLDGLNSTENSFKLYNNSFGWTSYEYCTVTERNKKAGRLGIQNFKENIDKVMLFCPEINSVKLNDNGVILEIKRNDIIDLSNECHKLTYDIIDGNKKFKKTFLFKRTVEDNKELSERFNKNRQIRICCAIELDNNNNIFINDSSPSLFCSLPLVGSETHKFPFIINSPDFEPDSERQSIFLNGKDIDEKNGKISESGINKMILTKSHEMYRCLLNYICNNNIGKRYLLARGLRSVPLVTKFFDEIWYEEYYIKPMRNILHEYPIVWNGTKYVCLNEIYIPDIKYYNEKNDRLRAYNFISQLYDKNVPTFKDFRTIDNISYKLDNIWDWLDDFLLFIKRFHPEFLENYAIIPNMNNTFVKLTNGLASSKNVPENIIECLENIGIDWKNTHIHRNILNYSTGTDHSIEVATSKIRECLKNYWSNKILILMQYIPEDKNEEFVKKRNMIYDFCSVAWKMGEKKNGNGFSIELWNGIDDIVFSKLIETIAKERRIGEKYTIEFLKKFLECVSKYYPNYKNHSIIPNQNGKFCKLDNLYNDIKIPKLYKKCLKNCFNYDIKEELIHNDLSTIKASFDRYIYNYSSILRKYFQMSDKYCYKKSKKSKLYINYMPIENKIEAARYLIRIIPRKNNDDDEIVNNNTDNQNKQRELFNLYKIFTKCNYDYVEIERSDYNYFGIWADSNEYIYGIIRNSIEKQYNVISLAKNLGLNEEDTLNYLKTFIASFSSEGKIIPNQNHKLCNIGELYNEGKWIIESEREELIPEELKDIAKSLGYDVRNVLIHSSMNNLCSSRMLYSEICKEIDKLINEKYEDPKNHSDPNFKNSVNNLIEVYFEKIGDSNAKKYFVYTYTKKEHITMNVIFDKKTRSNLAELGNKYGSNAIPKLLNNPKIIDRIVNGKLSDDNFNFKLEEMYGSDGISILLENPEIVQNIIKGKLSDKNCKTPSNDVMNESSCGSPYIVRSGSENIKVSYNSKISSKIGIIGEAYIYELLRDSGKFKNVTWKMLNDNGRNFSYDGKNYKILRDGSHYDIEVEIFNDNKIYIEVKSTKYEFGNNKIPFFLSKTQIDMMEITKNPDKYILAVVFNTLTNPKHFFMEMRNNININY
eukprot:jgi/Orpsp1_1/1177058/evm.model.c7180000060037.1